ncbi:SDR family oxidoreductase, partial [Brevibacillus sp. SIMBA_040]|uniref:SDR family oxidoreductase n=1 Tax=Brevibacillus sp. SIMBA_040 TaxID=3085781 RepID=UPI003978A777
MSSDVENLSAAIEREFGGLDIVVVNTSRPPNPIRATLDETDEARWNEAYQNQLWSTIQVLQRMTPTMRE